ncbi:MAG: heavy-metal-associated domain-containing protein [Clostridiales bacterium]|nr:heavy-metal-associated domain-containing protein [Clostridiales bacterium]
MCQECSCAEHHEPLITLRVSGMTGEAGKNAIEKALEGLAGVSHHHADPAHGTVSFYLSEAGSLEEIKQTLLKNGFGA